MFAKVTDFQWPSYSRQKTWVRIKSRRVFAKFITSIRDLVASFRPDDEEEDEGGGLNLRTLAEILTALSYLNPVKRALREPAFAFRRSIKTDPEAYCTRLKGPIESKRGQKRKEGETAETGADYPRIYI